MDNEIKEGNKIFDIKKGNTRIVIFDGAIESEAEQELIYERVRNIIINSQIRRIREIAKDAKGY